MEPVFSTRTSWNLEESALARAVRLAKATHGSRVLDLTVSNPTVCGFVYDPEAVLLPLSASGNLTYDPDPRGMRSARESVVEYYADHGANVDADAILLTTSTSEAYGYLFRLLCNAGDEVLVAQPSYPLFDFLADLSDVVLRPYALFYDFGWWIDFTELERQIGPRTRAILLVHPSNPTGHWTHLPEREQLREICRKHSLALIVDEVFLDYPLDDVMREPTFATGAEDVLTFVLSGMSKVAGLPQMKIAWILTLGPRRESVEALRRLEMIADTFLSVNAPMQHALPFWLATRRGMQRQIGDRLQTNLTALGTANIPMLRVEAGWSAVLRVPTPAESLLAEHLVVVHEGWFYGMAERNRLVVSLLTPEELFVRGLQHIVSSY